MSKEKFSAYLNDKNYLKAMNHLEQSVEQFYLFAIQKYKGHPKALGEIQTFCIAAKHHCVLNSLSKKDIVSTGNEILALADKTFTRRFNLKAIFINILFGGFTLGMGFLIKKSITGSYLFTAEETDRKKGLKFFIQATLEQQGSDSERLSLIRHTEDIAADASESPRKPASEKKTYLRKTYSSTHWAYHIPTGGDENFIATLEIFGIKMAITLNHTDARGYRSIIRFVQDDMESTFNREYSDTEKSALSIALALMSSVYEEFGMAINTEIAGNNSQFVKGGIIQMGGDHEPSILHGHVIGRGNPATCYIADVPLRGPEAGQLFNMRGDGIEPGNDKKILWNPGEMECITNLLAERLPHTIRYSVLFQKIISIDLLRPNPELDVAVSCGSF